MRHARHSAVVLAGRADSAIDQRSAYQFVVVGWRRLDTQHRVVLRGDVAPLDAAGQLWLLSHRHGVQFPKDSSWTWGTLDPDGYAAPGVKKGYEHDIRNAATRWLAHYGS